MVCNGSELASGSIPDPPDPTSRRGYSNCLALTKQRSRIASATFFKAFSYGPPPERHNSRYRSNLVMQLTDTENIREVIAFPKVGAGYDPMMGAPSTIDAIQWAELGLMLGK